MFALKLTDLSKLTARPKFFAAWPHAFRDIVLLFALGMTLGLLLRFADIAPGFHRQATPTARTNAPITALSANRGAEDVTSLTPIVTPAAVATGGGLVPLVGDGNAERDGLRRALIVTARTAMNAPCDADLRIAFQITLHDYARSFAAGPAAHRTQLDQEAARAIALSHHAGLIDPALVERWRGAERSGLASLLAAQGLSLSALTPTACRSG